MWYYSLHMIWEEMETIKKILRVENMLRICLFFKHLNLCMLISFMLIKKEFILSKLRSPFRKGFSTQHCLLWMLYKWKKPVENHQSFTALLTDFSKAFDCLNHNLLIAKLFCFGISLSWSLLADYLKNRKQSTKVESSCSLWDNSDPTVTLKILH